MKKWIVVAMVCAMAAPAMAQVLGLPIADGAAAEPQGLLRLSGGAIVGDDANAYGGRVLFGVIEGLALMADLGIVDPDGGDTGFAYAGGAKFTLPVDLPVDLAVRGTIGMSSYEVGPVDVDVMDISVGGLVSKTIEQFTPYGFLGFVYEDVDADFEGLGSGSDSDTEIAIAGGVLFALNEQISLYGELAHIDDLFFGLGGRFQF